MDSQPKGLVRDALAGVFEDPLTVLSIAVITLCLSIETPAGVLRVNANALASLIFPVAGTIVALALTAAGLASTFILRIAAEMPEIYEQDARFTREAKAQAVIKRAQQLRESLMPAWRGTILVLLSFLLSAIALVVPPKPIQLGISGVRLYVDGFFSSGSLACVLIGTLLFIPMVRFSFRGELLEQLLLSAENLRQKGATIKAAEASEEHAVKIKSGTEDNRVPATEDTPLAKKESVKQ